MRPYLPQMLPLEKLDLSAPDLIASLGEANRALARYDSLLDGWTISDLVSTNGHRNYSSPLVGTPFLDV